MFPNRESLVGRTIFGIAPVGERGSEEYVKEYDERSRREIAINPKGFGNIGGVDTLHFTRPSHEVQRPSHDVKRASVDVAPVVRE